MLRCGLIFRKVFPLAVLCALVPAGQGQEKAPGLGEPGKLQALRIEGVRDGEPVQLAGRDAGKQLLVTGLYSSGQQRDLSDRAAFTAPDAVGIDATGYMTARKEGEGEVRVTVEGVAASFRVRVTAFDRDLPVNFAEDVVPVLTRYGCNSGGCHGKSGGQNGFALSLLGFYPKEDYDWIRFESKGRRVLVTAPEHSLLLRKAVGQMPHGGGAKIPADSAAYRVLLRWVEQGLPYGKPDDPTAVRIEVLPRERLLPLEGSQQLAVIAHYSDGSTRDVTRLSQFEVNDQEVAEVGENGRVRLKGRPGVVAVMARFRSLVDAFRGVVPLGVPDIALPAPANFIDEHVFAHLKKLGLPPSELCDDATFLRRATLDLAGRLPTTEEVEAFTKDGAANRREKLVDRLLASEDYADWFACKWNAVLRNKRASAKSDPKPHFAFHTWIRKNLHENVPFDRFVRAVLTARGEETENPAVTWYREVNDVFSQVEDTAQLFLGTRLGCARCHHHPLEKWSQEDYYGLASFFSLVEYKKPPPLKKGEKKPKNAPPPPVHVVVKNGTAQLEHPRTGEKVGARVLDGKPGEFPKGTDPREHLAEWLTRPDNPYFARTLANRYWKHFLGRGLVEPEDDLRATNPPTNPALLDALAEFFTKSGYDLKKLVRTIVLSRTYQLSAVPNRWNAADRQNYSHFQPRRLPSEVLHDAIDQVTLAKTQFPGVPAGTRAVQLPDNAFDSYFLTVFGRPAGASACECERSSDLSLTQLLHLMNSFEVLTKIHGTDARKAVQTAEAKEKGNKNKKKTPTPPGPKVVPGQRAAQLAKDARPHAEKIRDLYLAAYARAPRPEELQLLEESARGQDARAFYEDLMWVLINSEEFLFVR